MSILKVNTIQHANGTEAMTIDSSGNLTAPNTFTSSGAITSTGGIYLGGTASSNLLDSYEEGTWTPTLTSGATSLDVGAAGSYVKIGQIVYLNMYVNLGGITGEVVLNDGSLPFVPIDVYGQSQVENTGVLFSESGDAMWAVYSGNSIHLYLQGTKLFSNGSGTTTPAGGQWRGSIVYRTSE